MEQDVLVSKLNSLFDGEQTKTRAKEPALKGFKRYNSPKGIKKTSLSKTKSGKNSITLVRPPLCVEIGERINTTFIQDKRIEALPELQKENIFFRESEVVNKIINKKSINKEDEKELKKIIKKASKNVFVVYGHNEELKDEVCQTLRDNGYNPLTLDKRNRIGGKTILDAIVAQAKECLTAVAICSADDIVQKEKESRNDYKQPRPNVFFEIGYLYHCYAMTRVLIVKTKDAKMCSDLDGVRYISDDKLNQLINSLNQLTNIKI